MSTTCAKRTRQQALADAEASYLAAQPHMSKLTGPDFAQLMLPAPPRSGEGS